jgi:cytochrome P450
MSYDALREPNFEKSLHDPIMAANEMSNLFLQFPWLAKVMFSIPPSITVKMQPGFATFFRMQQGFRAQIENMKKGSAKEARDKPSHRTVFQELLEGNLPAEEKDSLRLQGEASVVVSAGVMTTAWGLTHAAFHIIANPSVLKKLRAELDEAASKHKKLNWTALEKLPYLTGCVKEGVRLSYGVTARHPRLLSKPIAYQGWTIPARTPISMTNVDVCDDPAIFPEPRDFRPERWIGGADGSPPKAPNGSSLDRYYVPFGKGSRSCLGIK